MLYSVERFTTVEECNIQLQQKTMDRDGLVIRKNQIEHELEMGDGTSTGVTTEQELIALAEQIQAQEVALSTYPEGTRAYREAENLLNRYETRRNRLLNKAEANDNHATADRQLDVNKLDAEITQLNEFITVFEARRTAIEAAG